MSAPTYHSVSSAATQSAGDITQFLGAHASALLYQGTSQVSDTTTPTGTIGTNTGAAAQYIAQPFVTAVGQTTISRIELFIAQQGTGADTSVEIRTDNAGVPSNTTLYSITLPLDFAQNLAVSIPINLTGLTASTKYHIVIDGTGNTTNYLLLSRSATSVNAFLTSSNGGSGWAAGGFTLYFNVFSGVNGVLRNTYDDAGARWTTIDYTNSVAAGNTTPIHIGEYTAATGGLSTGALRSWRTCTFTSGQLTSVT